MKPRRWMLTLLLCAACGSGAPAPNWQSIEVTVEVGRIVTAPPVETMSLTDAQAQLPFEFHLPTWLPDDFVLQDMVEAVLPTEDWPYGEVVVTWLDADDATLSLSATTTPDIDSGFIGGGQTENVTVNEQAATLTRLGLKTAPRQLTLAWEIEGVRYLLEVGGDVLTEAELLKVAESLQ